MKKEKKDTSKFDILCFRDNQYIYESSSYQLKGDVLDVFVNVGGQRMIRSNCE